MVWLCWEANLIHRWKAFFLAHFLWTTTAIITNSHLSGDIVSGGGQNISLGDYTEEWRAHRRLVHGALQRCCQQSLHSVIERQALHLRKVKNTGNSSSKQTLGFSKVTTQTDKAQLVLPLRFWWATRAALLISLKTSQWQPAMSSPLWPSVKKWVSFLLDLIFNQHPGAIASHQYLAVCFCVGGMGKVTVCFADLDICIA